MNRAYRLVWNAVRDAWIPVAETTRGRGRRTSRLLVAATLSLGTAIAQAGGPSGGQVTAGSGGIAQSGALTTITQHSATLSLSWSSFDIAPQATVDFVQPSASAIAVNRIFDTNGTQILGHLNANGQVYLINPNGILFGPGAELNVGGLVASTLDLDSASLDANARRFGANGAGESTASVVNEGAINTAPGGYVALLGGRIDNQGVINAQLGTVALAAGNAVTLTFGGSTLLHLQVDQSVWKSVAGNSGLIRADGGQVVMTAGARDALVASVVNNTGVIEARTVDAHEGKISLLGGETSGTVRVGGTLDASAPHGGNGGWIETSAAHVEVADGARVTTAAASGLYGSWLIDPTDFTIAASGGDMTGAALSSELGTTPVVIQSSAGTTPGSGNVNVNDILSWSASTALTLTASNNVNINANITAIGNTAGLIINPNTANGVDAASGSGAYALLGGASITLSGTSPSLSIAGIPYTVINTLGVAGSTTGTDLQGINGALAGHYALGSNIDALATSAWNAGAGFTPIGSGFNAQFTGSFDGLGHSISNLTINRPTVDVIGLFGFTGAAAGIQNVGLVGASIAGASYVGGLVAINHATIADSYTTGSVSGGLRDIGGLVGINYGSISGSHATGSVSGSGVTVGGLVGNSQGGMLSNSYASGAVSGANYVGGLAGFLGGGGGDNLYATGAVSGSAKVGGLIGLSAATLSNSYATGSVHGAGQQVGGLEGLNQGTINNSYATGAVSGTTIDVGGLVGLSAAGTVNDSYWNTTTSGQMASAGGTGLTTTQMQTASNFGGFNFTTTPGIAGNNWVMVDADGTLNNTGIGINPVNGAGATFPMLASEYATAISNAHQLQLIAMALGANYTLAASIDASATTLAATAGSSDVWSTAGGFVPIGNFNSPATRFSGIFDGMGYTISELTIALPGMTHVGLFSITATGSMIENVGLIGGSVSGMSLVGGLVGANYGAINNSHTTGAVSGSNDVGGLVGGNYGGSISASYATGAVTGTANVIGGLVGINYGGSISSSHATGTVTAANYVGGLIGSNSSGTITTSYAAGSVSGSNRVGGLIGQSYGAISNCYATGVVTGTTNVGGLVGSDSGGLISGSNATGAVTGSGYVGGLVGTNFGTITTSYASGEVSAGGGNNVGGLVGRDDGAISDSYATGAVSGGSYIGGLAGNASTEGVEPITNTHATGAVSGSTDVGGLVGSNSFAISDSYATGSVVGTSAIGGLVGYNSSGSTVGTSSASGIVGATSLYVGGLVGANYGTISDSYATGSVAAPAGLGGGLAGNNHGTISNSYATGSVTGARELGGLIGAQYGSGSTVSNSYATGAVSGTTQAGGLVGHNYGDTTISNSYATGSVTSSVAGSGSALGGLVGQNDGAVAASFWNADIQAIGIGGGSTAGATGLNSAAMMTTASFSAAGWSISDTGGSGLVWRIYQGSTAPLLLSFLTPLTITAEDAIVTYDGAIIGASALQGTGYSMAGAADSGHLYNTSNAHAGVINVGNYAPTLYSDQQGYDIRYLGGTLTISPATLTETATPASRSYGKANPALSGSITGFLGSDTLANATTGTLAWTTTAIPGSQPGHYAIDAGGLTAMNYLFVEAAGNAVALTVQASTVPVIPPVIPPVAGIAAASLDQAQTAVGTLEANLPDPPTTDELVRAREPADVTVPELRVVRGGVKLPAELADAGAH